jgi:iron complex outermembrane receptor protein
MKLPRSPIATAVLCALAASHAFAQQPAGLRLPEVVVTANPLGSDTFELVPPVSVLRGRDLLHRRSSTLGETLSDLPGVGSSYFGPNASRPVIRGLDGDRVRILQNGVGMLDASSASADHAVAADPLVVDRIEVVRGPATLLYGGSAVGGVVNVIDNRVPQEAITGARGTIEARVTGGGDRERAGAAVFEAGNGRIALHADVFRRNTSDLRIPGLARSQRLRDTGVAPATGFEPDGTLPNSAARSDGGALGASATWASGHVGLSYSSLDTRYGTVAEPTVVIDMQSSRWELAGEARDLTGFVKAVKFKAARSDYEHQEVDAGVVGTRFNTKGHEARIEAVHGKLGPFSGAFGVQFNRSDFSALGAEAFVPQTNTDAKAAFLYEEVALGQLKLTFGGRMERTAVRSDGGGPIDASTGNPRFDPAQSRSFSARSGALGLLYPVLPGAALAANVSYTERAPTFQELFANGPHAATAAYEIGSAAFGKEKSKAVDVALRMRSGAHSGSVGVFVSRFDNYLALVPTANTRGADGELNPVDADGDGVADGSGEEVLAEFLYQAVPATFRGFEAQGRFRLSERGGSLDLELKLDYVHAHDRATGQPLPRIAPLRLGVALDYRRERFGARVDVVRARGQDRVVQAERASDGYTLVNATLSYRFGAQPYAWEVFLRGNNLLDREARNHVSFLKDVAPLPGRSLLAGVRATF